MLLPSHGVNELAVRDGRRIITLDQVQAIYDKAYRHPGLMGTDLDHTYDAVTKQLLLDFAKPLATKRLLDVGCGVGSLWEHVPSDVEGYALDISLVGVRTAAQRYPGLTASVSAAEYLPYPNGYFHCVIAADTIEHAFSPSRALAEIWRVLEPGGHFCTSFPVPDSLRKWGRNQLSRGRAALSLLPRLGWVLFQRFALFGRLDFQPIDRDKNIEEWRVLLEETGFQVSRVLEWPLPPEVPIVYLVHAIRAGEMSQ